MQLQSFIDSARAQSPWDFGNEVLYKLCRTYPTHINASEVIAKIWLIGRSYAAAIERRKNKVDANDDFYVSQVAPKIIESEIDMWINAAIMDGSWDVLLEAHYKTTHLFSEISGLEKRSLASKYLHFHVPNLFYIYDARAVEALRVLKEHTGRASNGQGKNDNEYRKFVEKCRSLQIHIKEHYQVELSPRELDKLLLVVQSES